MDITCSAEPCPIVLNSTCVFYEGDNLIYTGINNNDNLQTALQKIDQKFQDAGLGYIFSNGIEQLVPGGAVMLGGALNKNTTIGGLYNLAFAGTLEASALITTGGSSTDFVKGDGSLDPTNYQPAGNYISNLTGDVIANGPGSVAATLATVFGAPGTYGNSGSVPSITVDGKGRITNVTPIPINYPAQSLSFVGDVEGAGFTGSPVTLTLDTVNTDIYGSNNFLKFAVNGKGLITSATPVSGGDITTALGYVPVDDAIELTINGVAHDLTANRDWNVGTVTTVGVTVGTGISASVSNPNTNPVINIINTAPDQTVNLNAGFGISISGSYPNFTITNDYPDLPNEGVTSVSAGNLSPLFTTSVTDSTTTPALSFALSSAAANTVFAGPDGGAGAPTYRALVAADIPSLAYISSISVSAPLATTGGLTPTLSISQADSTTDGYLSSADWTTFNSKQPAGNYITDITGDATASGPGSACLTLATVNATGGTFGSSTQVPVITVNGKGLVTCVTTSNISGSLEFIGDVTGVGSTGTCTSLTLATVNNDVYTSETLLNIAVNGKGLITSANPTTAGDICSTLGYTPENVANKSTATSLGISNTLYPTQLAVKTYVDSATAGGIILQGDWNAATNTPNISGTTTTGWAWRVSVQGTTNLGGINDWHVGDLAVKSATGWVKIDNTENVTSVFGRFGTVIATTGDYLTCQVTECGDLYYTDARVRAAIGHTAPLTYCSTTGVFGISQSNTTTDGYLSATDWTTFNDKQPALGYTPVNQTRQLTINGTTHDLSADRTWNVGTVTSVTGSAPLSSSGGTTPNLTISQAGTASDGFLSSTDWNTFNNKTTCLGTVTNVAACTSTTGVSITGSPITSSGTLGINVSTASSICTGLLTAADWNTFNSHTGCTGTVTSVGLTSSTAGVSIACSPVTSSGTISLNIATASSICTGLLTASDWNSFNSRTSCTGTVTSVNATGTNISVTGGPITTSGTIGISLSGANVCSALGYTPYNASNPNGYTTCIGTVTSAGIVATNINVCNSPVTTSGNICLNLTGANVCSALGFSPAPSSALSAYLPLAGGTMSGILCSTYNTSSGRANLSFDVASSVLGNIHIQNGAGPSGSANQAAITFMGSVSNNAQAGIYVLNDNSNGTSMGFATTNSYAAGPQIFMTASNNGVVNFTRSNPTVQGNQILNAGNYNSYSPTLTGGGASGTWGISISGNADTVDGYHASTSTIANGIVVRDVNGYINGNYINMTDDGNPGGGTGITSFITKQGDNYYRSVSVINAANSIRAGATGTWSISVTGSADSVTGLTLTSSANGINPDSVTQNQLGYNTSVNLFGQTDGGLYSSAYSSNWIHQIYGDFRSGQIAIRGKQSGTWQAWRTVLDSGNYTSYALPVNGNWVGNTGMNDQRLFLRTNGDLNHYLWNAADDWEELNAYEGTGFRITSNTGSTGVLYVYGSSNGGYTYSPYSFRAPIFYDSQDTAYYVDPNSESNLYRFTSASMTRNAINYLSINSPFVTRSQQSRPYQNGTMGWENTNFNTVFANWGSGFIDTWSSPANAPGGSSHYIGLQGCHYNGENSSTVYGFQMACAGEADNRFFWRSAWPGIRSWVEMIHTGNIGSQSVSYANSAGSASSAARAFYSIDGFTNTGGHGSSWIQNELPAANNGAATGRVVLRQWCSEPNATWDWAGFGYNVANDGGSPAAFGRFNTNFGQAYMRFAPDGNWYFYNTNTSGTRTQTMQLTPSSNVIVGGGIGIGGVSPDVRLTVNGDAHISNYLYMGGTAGSVGSWGVRALSSGGNWTVNANSFTFDNVGYGGTWNFTISSGNAQASSSMRAPIFYDSNDTNYYLDPTSITSLRTVGSWRADSSTWDGEFSGKIQYHSSSWYIQAASLFIYRNSGGSNVFTVDQSGNTVLTGYLTVGSGLGSSDIYMTDSDEGTRRIHCNSNRIGFLTQAAGWGAWCNDDGSWESALSVTTNDWFYVNGGGGLYFSSYGRGLRSPDAEGNPYGNIATYGTGRNGWLGYAIGSQFTFMGRTSVDVGLHDTGFGWIWYSPYATGRMGIGTSTTSASYRLYVDGGIYATGDVVAYSDRRKKTNIETIENALEKVTSLRGVFYDKIGEESKGRQLGVIAQEVDEVLPEAVNYAADVDEYGVKYGNMVGVLIEAIKEQQKQIEELKSQLNGITS